MAVKGSQSASRVLAVLEKVARHQPIGLSALTQMLDADKSSIQRAVTTLSQAGWICPALGKPTRWRLTEHMLALVQTGQSSNDLRQRAHSTLLALRDKTGETILLIVADVQRFVVVDVLQSRQALRMAPAIGLSLPVRGTATGRAVLPYLSAREQIELLGAPPDAALLAEFKFTLDHGYAVNAGEVLFGSTNIAAPIFELDGRPAGAIVISAPTERLPVQRYAELGKLVLQAARSLSQSVPMAEHTAA